MMKDVRLIFLNFLLLTCNVRFEIGRVLKEIQKENYHERNALTDNNSEVKSAES